MAVELDHLRNGKLCVFVQCFEYRSFRFQAALFMSEEADIGSRWTFQDESTAIRELREIDLMKVSL